METKTTIYRTNVSQAFWCSLAEGVAEFKPAKLQIGGREDKDSIAWFDQLFKGGLLLPNEGSKPLTMLLAGPPGSGKTTLAMEICYRLARNEGEVNPNSLFSLYISADQEAPRIIDNARRYGYEDVEKHIVDFNEDSERPDKHDINRVAVWGKDEIRKEWKERHGDKLNDIVEIAITVLTNVLTGSQISDSANGRLRRLFRPRSDGEARMVQPDILVIDSLNIATDDKKDEFFTKFIEATSSGSKLVIFVLDSASAGSAHEIWEYACDIVVRLDYSNNSDYYLRTIEVIKSRYQSHVWGKQQLKIYEKPSTPSNSEQERDDMLRRSHPYRSEGGIFIYPSIHYYLSLYKRRGPTKDPSFAQTRPNLTGVLEHGFPEGRCTAFIGSRGGHKSHFGYLHLLHRLVNSVEEDEAALVISLRDDERMTRKTMDNILKTEFPDSRVTLQSLIERNRLDFLYYHPGNITPEEFFHRMFIGVHRLKKQANKLTVLFNSLDQLRSRFPLCAKQEIFVPGIIEFLSGEEATSIFIAVDERGQPAEQYGLLPMADLILSFYPRRFAFDVYRQHLEGSHSVSGTDTRPIQGKESSDNENAQYVEEIVLQVVRFAGGQRAGAQGLLELVGPENLGLYDKPGLRFTKLSPKYDLGTPLFRHGVV